MRAELGGLPRVAYLLMPNWAVVYNTLVRVRGQQFNPLARQILHASGWFKDGRTLRDAPGGPQLAATQAWHLSAQRCRGYCALRGQGDLALLAGALVFWRSRRSKPEESRARRQDRRYRVHRGGQRGRGAHSRKRVHQALSAQVQRAPA